METIDISIPPQRHDGKQLHMLSLVTLIADFLPIIAIAGVAFTSLYDLIIALAGHSENTKGVLTHSYLHYEV